MHTLQKMHALNVRHSSPSAPPYTANAVQFDGVNDWLSKASAISSVTSAQGTLVVRLNPASMPVSPSARPLIRARDFDSMVGYSTQGFLLFQFPDGGLILNVNGGDSGDSSPCSIFAGAMTSALSTSSWQSGAVMCSWDTNFSAGNKLVHMYVHDTDVASLVQDDNPAFSLNYSAIDDIAIGGPADGAGDVELYSGGMSEVFFSPVYTDLSIEANRRRWDSPSGKPISLGADGSLALGSVPALYFNHASGSFHINKGSGGNMVVNGALTAAATSPSD